MTTQDFKVPAIVWEGGERKIIVVEQIPIEEKIRRARRAAYEQETDPIAFQVLRGERPRQEWVDAVAAIRARLPYPPAKAAKSQGS
jgi:hypothetical protein